MTSLLARLPVVARWLPGASASAVCPLPIGAGKQTQLTLNVVVVARMPPGRGLHRGRDRDGCLRLLQPAEQLGVSRHAGHQPRVRNCAVERTARASERRFPRSRLGGLRRVPVTLTTRAVATSWRRGPWTCGGRHVRRRASTGSSAVVCDAKSWRTSDACTTTSGSRGAAHPCTARSASHDGADQGEGHRARCRGSIGQPQSRRRAVASTRLASSWGVSGTRSCCPPVALAVLGTCDRGGGRSGRRTETAGFFPGATGRGGGSTRPDGVQARRRRRKWLRGWSHAVAHGSRRRADRWQVRTKQVYALVNRGEVPCVRISRYRRFRLEAIEAWERDQEGGF